ncbi:50S ribosomal protein L6 [Patescibacteria group bacterium]|nr:50S ribosomal protein L6 [Patescibacteria group bacterium]
MSKIGKKSIAIPSGIEVTINGQTVSVKGTKGTLSYTLLQGVSAVIADGEITVSIDHDDKKNLWGLSRTLIANMIEGLHKGYEKKLQVLGVGYTAKMQGTNLQLALGFSHPIVFNVPKVVTASTEKDPKGNDIITLVSIDKEVIGETAAKIRALKAPEPYKGKGIRYIDEVIKLKAGKAAKK